MENSNSSSSYDEKLGEIKGLLSGVRDTLKSISDDTQQRKGLHEQRFAKIEEHVQSIDSTIQKIATRDELVKTWTTPLIKGLKVVGKVALVILAAIIISRYPGAIDIIEKILKLFGL